MKRFQRVSAGGGVPLEKKSRFKPTSLDFYLFNDLMVGALKQEKNESRSKQYSFTTGTTTVGRKDFLLDRNATGCQPPYILL